MLLRMVLIVVSSFEGLLFMFYMKLIHQGNGHSETVPSLETNRSKISISILVKIKDVSELSFEALSGLSIDILVFAAIVEIR